MSVSETGDERKVIEASRKSALWISPPAADRAGGGAGGRLAAKKSKTERRQKELASIVYCVLCAIVLVTIVK